MFNVVIVGGGIAGLSAAWELVQRGQRPLVLERTERAGGVILTETVDGFVIDAGPDALLVQKPAAIDLCRELGLADRLFPTLAPRTAFVVRNRRLVPLPEASVLGLPTRLRPFLMTRLFSWPGKLRMALEPGVRARRDLDDESIGSFVARRFGREAVTYLAEPLLAGIHVGDVDRLSMRASFPRLIDAERTHGSVLRALWGQTRRRHEPAAPEAAFKSLPGGIGELVQTLVARLPPDTIRHGAAVDAIEGSGPYTIRLAGGEALDARSVILACPAWAAAPILAPIDRQLADLVGRVPYVSSATIVMALGRDQIRHPLAGSGFVVPRVERRTLMAATWVSSKWPGRAPAGCALLRGFVGGASDPDALDRTDADLTEAAFGELASLLDIKGAPLFTRVYRWPRANPQHEVGHLARMRVIDERLAAQPGLYLTGSGFRGTGIPDCVADGRATGARVSESQAG